VVGTDGCCWTVQMVQQGYNPYMQAQVCALFWVGDCKDEVSHPRPGGCPRWSMDGVMGLAFALRGVCL
jgi:hypothetical protein